MELSQISNGMIVYGADGEFSLVAGDPLKMEVGEDELSEVVPAGKKWTVTISLKIEEENI